MRKKKFKTEYCKMCNKETTHEDYYGKDLDRCCGCLLTKDQIQRDLIPSKERFTSYREEIYVSGDPNY